MLISACGILGQRPFASLCSCKMICSTHDLVLVRPRVLIAAVMDRDCPSVSQIVTCPIFRHFDREVWIGTLDRAEVVFIATVCGNISYSQVYVKEMKLTSP